MDKGSLYAAAERTCTSFASKIAMSFTTQEEPRGVMNNFWREVSQNAMDLAVLDWCHLFGNKRDVLHWTNVFSEDPTFKQRLLEIAGVSEEEWTQYWGQMRKYRDKDVAHLEIQKISMRPAMAIAIKSTTFYFSEVQAARARLGIAHQRMLSLDDILDSNLSKFDKQAALAFAGTGTQRKSAFS